MIERAMRTMPQHFRRDADALRHHRGTMHRFHGYRSLALSLVVLAFASTPALTRDEATEYSQAVRATTLLRTTSDVAGTPLSYPTDGPAEVSGLLVELPAGAETGWHRHSVPCFAYILSGEIAVEQKDGPTRTFRTGDAFAELVGIEHNGRTIGTEPVRLVFFAAGVKGQPFTLKEAAVTK